jgi:broad specificity phosphatase PhoE
MPDFYSPTNNNTKQPIAGLDNKIFVDKTTGQIFMSGQILSLNVPILVIRHGQTNANLQSALQGQVDGPDNQLNSTGRKQAQKAAIAVFSELKQTLDTTKLYSGAVLSKIVILTSPLTRSLHTAEYFVKHFKQETGYLLEIEKEEGLIEMSFGKYDGYCINDIDDEGYQYLVTNYRTTQNATIDWQNTGESFIDTVSRAKTLLEKLNEMLLNSIVIAFAHGTLISALRTVVGDKSLLRTDGMIAFRDSILENAEPYWLGNSKDIMKHSDF